MTMGLSPPQLRHRWSKKLFNKLQHSANGNRQHLGIKSCTWNCKRGLLDSSGHATPKLAETHNFLLTQNIDIMALNEAGIHGRRSQTFRANPMTTTSINREIALPGYKILLPYCWTQYDTARIAVYVRTDITTIPLRTQIPTSDLPVISFKAQKGSEALTAYNFFYREFTGGISRMKSQEAQAEQLTRLLATWAEIDSHGLDTVYMGHMNHCATKWADISDPNSPFIDKVKTAQVTQTLDQTVSQHSRSQLVVDRIHKSTIDHVYTNSEHKLKTLEVWPVGDSDHLGVVVTKITKHASNRPATLRLRQYKQVEIHALQAELVSQDK